MSQWLVIGISGITCGGKTTLAHSLREYFQSQRNMQLLNTPYKICDVRLISQDDYFLPVDDVRHQYNEKLNAINFELITSLDMNQMILDIGWIMQGQQNTDESTSRTTSTHTPTPYALSQTQTMPASVVDTSLNLGFPTLLQNYHYQKYRQLQHNQQQQQLHTNYVVNNNSQRHVAANKQQQQKQSKQRANAIEQTSGDGSGSGTSDNNNNNNINILIIEGFMIFNQVELLKLCNIKFHFHLPYEKCFERRQSRTYDPPDVTGYFELCVWPHYEKNFDEYRTKKDIIFLNGEIEREKIFKFALQKIVNYFDEHCNLSNCPPQKILGINLHIQAVRHQLQQLQQQQQQLKQLHQKQLHQQQQQQQQHEYAAKNP